MTSPPSLHRPAEFTQVQALWRQLSGKSALRTVVITGPPEVGKSRFVSEALARLIPAPGCVLVGSSPAHAPAPYDWTASALRNREADVLANTIVSGDTNRDIAQDAVSWLLQNPAAPNRRFEPTALERTAVDIVQALQSTLPGVIVVEDLQWLDPASVSLIEALSHTAPLSALLVVVSREPDAHKFGQPAAELLKQLCDEPGTLTIPLEPAASPEPDGEAAWARYCYARGQHHEAAVAALRGAARLLANGYRDEAIQLIDSCMSINDTADTGSAEQVLAHSLTHLGKPTAKAGVTKQRTTRSREDVDSAINELTAREREVLGCLADGMSNRQVARRLGISIRTVTVHVSNLLRKTATTSRTEAALWAVQRGLRADS